MGSTLSAASSEGPRISIGTSAECLSARDEAAVLGVEGRLDLCHCVELRDAGDHCLHRRLEGGVVRRQRIALDQDLFSGRLL